MAKEPRGFFDTIDNWLLVAVVAVAALVVLQVLRFVVGTVVFLLKAALVVVIVLAVARAITRRSR